MWPTRQELGTFEVDGGHISSDTTTPWGIGGVEFTAHSETGFGGSGRNQLDDHPIADESLARQFWLMKEKRRCSILFHGCRAAGG
jgi:hypothetical protein